MRDASDPGFAALDATITKALLDYYEIPLDDQDGVADIQAAARAVRDALIAEGHVCRDWGQYAHYWRRSGVLVIPLGVGVAPDQHNTPHEEEA